MTGLAFIRTSQWETPLFFHVAGAMLLVGGIFVVSTSLVLAWRAQQEADVLALTRFAYRTLFILVLPAFILMRLAAEWVLSNSPFDSNQNWVGIGYLVSDIGAVVLLVSLILAGIGLRRARDGRGHTAARVVTVLTLLLLVGYLVAVWAMTTKPT